MDIRRKKFREHRWIAKRRSIPFLFTFDEWWKIWNESGHWQERGKHKGQYVMARYGDKGPYAVGNVKIIKAEENIREWKRWKRDSFVEKIAPFLTYAIDYDGRRMLPSEFCELTGVSKTCLRNRIRRGWSIEEILRVPVEKHRIPLTEDQVMKIRWMLEIDRKTPTEIGKLLGIPRTLVYNIKYKRSFKHLLDRSLWTRPELHLISTDL